MKIKSQFADKFFIAVVIVSFIGVSLIGSVENGRPSILFIPLCVSSNPNVPCIPLGGGDCSSSTGAIFCATPKPAPSNGGANRIVCPDGSIVTDATLCAGRNAPNVINKLFPGSSSTGLGSNCQLGTYWDNSKLACVTNTDCLSGQVWSASLQQCVRDTNAIAVTSTPVATYQQCYDGTTVPVSVACPQPPPSTVSGDGVTQIPTKICYDGSVVTAQSNCPPIPQMKSNTTSATNNVQYVQCQNGLVVQFGTSCPSTNVSNSNNGNGGNSSSFPALDTRTILVIIIAIITIVIVVVLWKSRKK